MVGADVVQYAQAAAEAMGAPPANMVPFIIIDIRLAHGEYAEGRARGVRRRLEALGLTTRVLHAGDDKAAVGSGSDGRLTSRNSNHCDEYDRAACCFVWFL